MVLLILLLLPLLPQKESVLPSYETTFCEVLVFDNPHAVGVSIVFLSFISPCVRVDSYIDAAFFRFNSSSNESHTLFNVIKPYHITVQQAIIVVYSVIAISDDPPMSMFI